MNNDAASSTALLVMQGILITAKKAEHSGLVSEELFQECCDILSSSSEGRKRLKQVDSWWGSKLLALKEKLLMPGITLHYVLRKRFIEDYINIEILKGAKQVINLGAGFDTLLYRLSKKYSDVNFIEVDHPYSQKAKLSAIKKSSLDTRMINYLPMCFEEDNLQEQLLSSSFYSENVKTIYVVEGVLMYLDKAITQRVFQSLTALNGNEHKVIFTATEPFSSNPKSSSLLFKMYLAFMGEPLAWSCKKTELCDFLKPLNYQLIKLVGKEEFKQLYLKKSFTGSLPSVEYIAVAESGKY